jgi:lysophospholipase L1-like esterase
MARHRELLRNLMPDASSRIRVVALGDSLTVGFQPYGLGQDLPKSTPYTDFLIDQISRDFPSDSLAIEIINKGVVGELSDQMVARFDLDVIHLSPRVVIILGGSNDLGWGLPPEEILQNLDAMYMRSRENHITPIGCTVPSVLRYDAGIPPRIILNRLIQDRCREMGIRCVDVFRATLDSSNRLALQYSSDGLHLNSEGCRRMGAAIYEEGLRPILRGIVEGDLSSPEV